MNILISLFRDRSSSRDRSRHRRQINQAINQSINQSTKISIFFAKGLAEYTPLSERISGSKNRDFMNIQIRIYFIEYGKFRISGIWHLSGQNLTYMWTTYVWVVLVSQQSSYSSCNNHQKVLSIQRETLTCFVSEYIDFHDFRT